jgi:ribosomal protein L37AE/L43A
MKCVFCHKSLEERPAKGYFTCPHCNTTQETALIDRPYLYTVGDRANLEAPHVPVRAM